MTNFSTHFQIHFYEKYKNIFLYGIFLKRSSGMCQPQIVTHYLQKYQITLYIYWKGKFDSKHHLHVDSVP